MRGSREEGGGWDGHCINNAYIIAVITLLIFPRGPSECSTEIRRKSTFSPEVVARERLQNFGPERDVPFWPFPRSAYNCEEHLH